MKTYKKSLLIFVLFTIAIFSVFAQTEDPLAEEPDIMAMEVIEEKGKLYTLRKDLTKYDNEKNLAIYTSFIKFEK